LVQRQKDGLGEAERTLNPREDRSRLCGVHPDDVDLVRAGVRETLMASGAVGVDDHLFLVDFRNEPLQNFGGGARDLRAPAWSALLSLGFFVRAGDQLFRFTSVAVAGLSGAGKGLGGLDAALQLGALGETIASRSSWSQAHAALTLEPNGC
jgi:hypothetical protein